MTGLILSVGGEMTATLCVMDALRPKAKLYFLEYIYMYIYIY